MEMCAISGILDLNSAPWIVERMKSTMVHRGPDAFGCHQEESIVLLHARLAVIDPAGGRQPMIQPWGGEKYTIVYNGELYNTQELRRELVALGHQFTDHSDTAVVLHSYIQWGPECLKKFNGIFAFGIWESRARRLFLARDRIGVKPLFYAIHQGGMLFASELKTILAYPEFRAAIDLEGASELLLLGPGRTPGCGVFLGIRELEPGCFAYWEQGRIRLSRYWRLTDGPHPYDLDQTMELVRELVTDSIRRQLVSDVPVGCFLSGGLDSSLICSVAARELEKQGSALSTFSVDYEHNDRYFIPGKFQPNTDSDFIGTMEQYLGCDPHRVMLSAKQLDEALEDATVARDLPGMADVDFSLLLFCREIRENVTVALSGECADEIFGGYPWYRDPEIRAQEGFPWAQSTTRRATLLRPGLTSQENAKDYVLDRYHQTIQECDIAPGQPSLEIRMKQMMNLNFRWFMQTLLDRKDRMSMACALEVRVPFCDWRIAQTLYRVPWEMKEHNGYEKGLLRSAMTGFLPEEILWRKKSPYPKTYDPEYLNRMNRRMDRLILDRNAPLWSLIDPKAVQDLRTAEMTWPWYGQLMKLPQTLAYLCQIDFWLRRYNVDIRI